MSTVDPKELSTEELEKILQERRRTEYKERAEKKQRYEENRDKTVHDLWNAANMIHGMLLEFKTKTHEVMDEQEKQLNEYGAIRSNSKGGFSITSSDGQLRITRILANEPTWDERANKAVELLTDFLNDSVKKRNRKIFEILMSFIAPNKKGELEYSKVMDLLTHRDKYNDPRWTEGLNLIQESYSLRLRAIQYAILQKDEQGKWERVELNFSGL